MKRIIDTESPEFDGIPMRLRESHQGRVLLAEDRRPNGSLRGITTIGPEELASKMDDVFEPEALAGLTAAQRQKPMLDFIAEDTDDKMGHGKHLDVYDDMLDDAVVMAQFVASGADPAAIRVKVRQRMAQI